MTNYYLFAKNNSLNLIKNKYKNATLYKILLTEDRIKRLFVSSQSIATGNYNMLILKLEDNDFTFAIEFEQYFNDCNVEVKNIIDNDANILGYSSKSQNKKIESIIDFESIKDSSYITKMYGENGWNSLKEFFECLNHSEIKYVSLRKNENLPNGFIDGDKDIDILCENKEEFVRIFCLKKRSLGISGYKLLMLNDEIPIDIRFKGDYYFDTSWEQKILDNREMNTNGIYVMDKENQNYTIIYHIITQKENISSYYEKYLKDNGFLKEYDKIIDFLSFYMNKNGYLFHKPIDLSVYQNKKNIKLLNKSTKKYKKLNIIGLDILSKVPNIFFIKNIKNGIIKKGNF